MSSMDSSANRREFLKATTTVGAALGLAGKAFGAHPTKQGRVIGANDKINIGIIGVGGRGFYVAREFAKAGESENAQIVAVCDVWEKRKAKAAAAYKAQGYLDYREVLNRDDIDAVVVATPDHWHATIALEAMDRGKDVYLEKPMCHTIDEAKKLTDTVRETKRVLQVGSQTTSGDQWSKARKAIQDGMIGQVLMSQGSYHRNSKNGEWNWDIDAQAGPDGKGENYIDWKMWLGPSQKRTWDADRYFRFRKYWDYSGGIATDLFYHVVAPMNIVWGEPQFPYKVMADGGVFVFKNRPEDPQLPDREVPDTFSLMGTYSKGHQLVLSASMANSQHIPGLIRGHEGSIIMVEHGRFEGYSPFITVKPETRVISDAYKARWGDKDIKIAVEENDTMQTHVKNFLQCIRSRQKPRLDVETGARAQVLISMAVQSYREGRVLYFDEKTWKVSPKPTRA
ncbi:MAG: Gfo/Idh/MocA family oxidoreductase [Bryobacteraceae bacterium]|nr:Gfo/Idh/MocA family oxidoreductase [Bryobacteraceae bacterium]